MKPAPLNIEKADVHKLLCAANPDAALVYLYVQSGNDPKDATRELQLTDTRLQYATATLRQLGLWPEEKARTVLPGERPQYTETDVLTAMNHDTSFRALYGDVQQRLGRALNTEELKILLGFVRYLGLPEDVISLLIHYCVDRARQLGKTRNPSLRTIEKEAYHWAELGIDSIPEAVSYIQGQTARRSRLGRLMQLLQIRGRSLTPGEEKYAQQWLDWGFDESAISLAYERTCLNTGGLNWAYMNKILTRWQQAGLLNAQQVSANDTKPVPKGATGQLGEAELEAIRKVLQEV